MQKLILKFCKRNRAIRTKCIKVIFVCNRKGEEKSMYVISNKRMATTVVQRTTKYIYPVPRDYDDTSVQH